MKKLKELKGVKLLCKKEQKGITGGFIITCSETQPCLSKYCCEGGYCIQKPFPDYQCQI